MKYRAPIVLFLAYSSVTVGQFSGDSLANLFGNALDILVGYLGQNIVGSTLEDSFETYLLDVVPPLFGQKPFNADGRYEQNKAYLLQDTSNDEIALSSVRRIIERSGFRVQTHRVVSGDGYVTILYHVINPLADQSKLKRPPVMVMHGGLIDATAYIWASAIQHHPEKYPRTTRDGPITSSNRSLCFMLANNGYDVWLVSTRGSNADNQDRVRRDSRDTGNGSKSFTSIDYWRFSFDELIQDEAPKQLDRILELTGARNVSLFAYSYSGTITLPLLGSRPDIAENKIHNYICLAPFLNIDSSNTILKGVAELVLSLPNDLGTKILSEGLTTEPVRRLIVDVAQSKKFRYSVGKFIYSLLLGSSGQYRSNLELPVLGHIFQPTSFQEMKHSFQITRARRYQMYDYGLIENLQKYGQIEPPAYNISNIHVKNWILITGQNDNFSPASTTRQVLEQVNPKPLRHVEVPGVGHLDLVVACDNAVQVNFPVLKFLDQFAF